jgi:hypothetical protein
MLSDSTVTTCQDRPSQHVLLAIMLPLSSTDTTCYTSLASVLSPNAKSANSSLLFFHRATLSATSFFRGQQCAEAPPTAIRFAIPAASWCPRRPGTHRAVVTRSASSSASACPASTRPGSDVRCLSSARRPVRPSGVQCLVSDVRCSDGRWPHRRAVIVAERGGCGPPQHGSASPAASWCQDVRMPTVPCSPPCPRLPSASAFPASAPSGVRPSSVRRPVRISSVRSSGVRCPPVQCPVSACPVSGVRLSSVRCPPVQCPVSACPVSGASVRHLCIRVRVHVLRTGEFMERGGGQAAARLGWPRGRRGHLPSERLARHLPESEPGARSWHRPC